MPKVIKKRISKHENPEESLQETVEDIRGRLRERQRILVRALAAFLVVLVVICGFYIYNKTRTAKAAELQGKAYNLFYSENGAQSADGRENYKKALDLFMQAYEIKKSADILLYVAYCQYELGNYDDSIKSLKELIGKYSDQRITPLAYYKMAEAYLKKGDSASALATLKDLSNIKDAMFRDMALMENGKILESQGKSEEAKAVYKELIAKFPNSVFVAESKAKAGE
ncbi:MAG TPA: tetratricopeptide repeat protein [Dissulfurispiraceae bacterium]|nr:tetratricopeptide repeat protein [Dissulfurispiraceae bacterium]